MESSAAHDEAAAHELTWEQFSSQVSIKKVVFGGLRWSVALTRRLVYFSDAPTAEDAAREAHRHAVASAVELSGAANWDGSRPSMPPAAVLAQYPDLVPG